MRDGDHVCTPATVELQRLLTLGQDNLELDRAQRNDLAAVSRASCCTRLEPIVIRTLVLTFALLTAASACGDPAEEAAENPTGNSAPDPAEERDEGPTGQPAPTSPTEAELYWGQWRGPHATGVAPYADPPVSWSEDQNIRWKVEIPGLGHSSPVVWGDGLFITTAIPYGDPVDAVPDNMPGTHDNAVLDRHHEFVVMALARENGSTLWRRTVRRELPKAVRHITGTFASASPTTDGEHLFAFFGSAGLYAFDLDGEPLWQKDFGDMAAKHGHGEGATPVLHGDTLVVNWDHEEQSFIVALDKNTGEELWRKPRNEVTSWSSPIVVEHAGRHQVIVPGTSLVRAYDLETGEVIWECGGMSHNIVASPVSADGMVFLGSSYQKAAMLAIRLEGATGDIGRTDNLVWMRRAGTPYVPSPLLYGGWLYFMNHYQGFLVRARAATGEEPVGPFRLGGIRDVYSSPVGAAGRVYITGREGATIILDHSKAPPEFIGLNRLDDSFSASMAIVGSEIYLRGERYLYCIAQE